MIAPADWQRLLEPVSGGDPCGISLRYDGAYDQIRRARQCDDESLARGVWETTPKKADWGEVAAICTTALEQRSKDLQLAAWLLEAWLHLHGFGGAAAGLALIHGLFERYWEGLHPRPENGDWEFRFSVIRWINEKLPTGIKLIPLTAPAGPDGVICSWADRERAQHMAQAGSKIPGGEEAAASERARFQQSLAATPAAHLEQVHRDTNAIAASCRQIEQRLDTLGLESPGLVAPRQAAEAISAYLVTVLERRGPAPIFVPVPEKPLPSAKSEGPPLPDPLPAGIRSRQEAYALLSAAAAFLMATEPHSPVPYLVERAVAWGAMSLKDLLPELLRENNDLAEIHRLLGIGPRGASPKL